MKLSEFKAQNAKNSSVDNDDIMKKYNELKDLPSDQLSKMLLEEVARQKREGVFNYEELNSMVESMRAMMPSETYENMKRILGTFR